jgi:hypothetical protein
MMKLTADLIERRVEKFVDHLDGLFMNGKIDQAEYDSRMKAISEWADAQYERMRGGAQ